MVEPPENGEMYCLTKTMGTFFGAGNLCQSPTEDREIHIAVGQLHQLDASRQGVHTAFIDALSLSHLVGG